MLSRRFRESLTSSESTMLEDLLVYQPLMRLHDVNERLYVLRGSLNLYDPSGSVRAAFPIEMGVPRNFPNSPPVIREVGGLIPQIADRHVNAKDATCCIQLPIEFHKKRPKTLRAYIEGPVTSYFLAQLYYDCFKEWPNGERAHGAQGLREYCREEIASEDLVLIRGMIKVIQQWHARPKDERCPCGGHRKIYKCHDRLFDAVQRWSPEVRQAFLEMFDGMIQPLIRS